MAARVILLVKRGLNPKSPQPANYFPFLFRKIIDLPMLPRQLAPDTNCLWAEKHKPKKTSDLAMHPSKVSF